MSKEENQVFQIHQDDSEITVRELCSPEVARHLDYKSHLVTFLQEGTLSFCSLPARGASLLQCAEPDNRVKTGTEQRCVL